MINVTREVAAMANMASAVGLTVKLLPDDDGQPRTCMKTKVLYLPRPKWSWNAHEIEMWRHAAWHEVGHHHPSQQALTALMESDKIDYQSPLGTVINCLDDVWQEMVTTREYTGAGRTLSFGQGELIKKGVENVKIAKTKGRSFTPGLLPGMMLAYSARSEWQTNVREEFPKLLKVVDEGVQYEHLKDRVNGIIDHPNPAQEVVNLAREIIKGEGIDPDSKQGKGKPEKGEGEINYEDIAGHAHSAEGTATHRDEIVASERFEANHRLGEYIPYDTSDVVVSKPSGTERAASNGDLQRMYDASACVGTRIARLFQTATQSGRQYQQKRGKLTPRHLTRGALGDPRIFNRKIDKIDNKAAVYFLVDCSGSMGGRRYLTTMIAVTNMSKALDISGVPHKVAGFTEREPELHHYIFKDWEEKYNWDTFRGRAASAILRQNADGDSVMFSYNELLSTDHSRKILIVLSDGEPCCDRPGNSDDYLRVVTEHIEKAGKVELYGIGIMTDTSEYYRDSVQLRNENEIEDCITEVVKEKIIKSH